MKRKSYHKIIIVCLLVVMLLPGSHVYADDRDLPAPGVTPDSPFYVFDSWMKKVSLFFTFDSEARVRKALEYAEERLAEAQVMSAEQKAAPLEVAANEYEKYLSVATRTAQQVQAQSVTDEVSELLAVATSKHISVLDDVQDKAPEEAKGAIIQARENSVSGQKEVLKVLAVNKPARAMEINLGAIEEKLNRVRNEAAENDIAGLSEALNEAEAMYRFGEEISLIARDLGIDEAIVDELVSRATTAHLKVLAGVYDEAPAPTKQAIKRVMDVSAGSYEKTIASLNEKKTENEAVLKPTMSKSALKVMSDREATGEENTGDNGEEEDKTDDEEWKEKLIQQKLEMIEQLQAELDELEARLEALELDQIEQAELERIEHELEQTRAERLAKIALELEELERKKKESLEQELELLRKKKLEKLEWELLEEKSAIEHQINKIIEKIEYLEMELKKLL